MLKCGASEIVITPALGSPIPGSVNDRLSDGVVDPLYAKAVVWETEITTAAVVSLDAIDIPRKAVEAIRTRASKSTRIPESHIMVSCTHTHTGGPTIRTSYVAAVDETYLQFMADRAAEAIELAWQQRSSAQIGYARGHEADIAFNRRFRLRDGSVKTNPGIRNSDILEAVGPIDPEVLVIRIDKLDGQPIAVISNYACHPCVIGGTAYSGDYPGELSAIIKRVLGPGTVSLFLQGASGDINHIDTSGRFPTQLKEHYKTMGRILAGEVLKVREKAIPSPQCSLQMRSSTVPLRYRQPTPDQIAAAHQLLQQSDLSLANKAQCKMAEQIIELAMDNAMDSAAAEIQTLTLDDELAIVGLPAEQFVHFGLHIKQHSPFPYTMISQLTNGSVSGYVCTREAHRQGGYETLLRPYSRLQEDAGDLLAAHALHMLRQH